MNCNHAQETICVHAYDSWLNTKVHARLGSRNTNVIICYIYKTLIHVDDPDSSGSEMHDSGSLGALGEAAPSFSESKLYFLRFNIK